MFTIICVYKRIHFTSGGNLIILTCHYTGRFHNVSKFNMIVLALWEAGKTRLRRLYFTESPKLLSEMLALTEALSFTEVFKCARVQMVIFSKTKTFLAVFFPLLPLNILNYAPLIKAS